MTATTMTTQEAYDALNADITVSAVLMEWVSSGGLPWESRDARIEGATGDAVAEIVLDDDGYGEHRRTVSATTAEKLVRYGLIRDAR